MALRVGVVLGVGLASAACASERSRESGVSRERSGVALGPPLVSADFALGAPVHGPRNDVTIQTVAAGPAGYLVLSERNIGVKHHELLGTRVLEDGTITDPQGVLIATTEAAATWGGGAAARWTGDRWLVAYGDSVWTVDADGKPGSSAPHGLSGYIAGMSWDGVQALVTTRAGSGVFVSAEGSVSGSPFTIHPVNAEGAPPVFDGTNHLVSYFANNPATVHVASVGPNGPTGKTVALYAPASPRPWVAGSWLAAGGGSALAQYYASQPACALGGSCNPLRSYYQILNSTSDGTISLGGAPALTAETSMTYASGLYVLYANADVSTVTTLGVLTGPSQPLLADVSAAFWETAGASSFVLTPSLGGSGFLANRSAWAGRVGSDFSLRDDPLLAPISLPLTQATPVATFDGANYLAAWGDTGRVGIAAARVSASGTVLDAEPRMIATGTVEKPVAASNGENSVAGWFTSNAIGLAQVQKDLSVTPLDTSPLASSWLLSASLASDGTDYFLGFSTPVLASLVSGAGVVSAPIQLDARQMRIAATYDGENYVLVWMLSNGGTMELHAARITPSLVPIDVPDRILVSFPGTDTDLYPYITSDGTRSLLTWTQATDSTIRIGRVSRELELLDPGGVVVTSDTPNMPGVVTAWDGARYWAVWEGELGGDGRHTNVYGRRFTPEATPLDDAPFLVTADLVDRNFAPDLAIGLAADRAGGLLFTYQQDDVATHGFRVRGRMLGTVPDGEGGGGGGANGGTAGTVTGGTGGVVIVGPGGDGGTSGDAGGALQGGNGGAPGGNGGEPPAGAAGDEQGGGAGTTAGRGGAGAFGGGGHGGGNAGRGQGGGSGRGGGTQAGEGGEGGVAPSAGNGGSSAGRGGGGHGGSGNAGAGHAGAGHAGTAANGDSDSGCNCSVPSRSSGFGPAWVIALGAGLLSRRRRGAR